MIEQRGNWMKNVKQQPDELKDKNKLLKKAFKIITTNKDLKMLCNYLNKKCWNIQNDLELIMIFSYIYGNRFINKYRTYSKK